MILRFIACFSCSASAIISEALLRASASISLASARDASLVSSADFSARTNSLFACYICGHTHRQSIGKNTAYTDQVVYINDTSCLYAGNNSSTMWPSYWSLLARNPKGKTQDVLTVLCIDTANKMINLVRVGADKNMYGDDSSFINYSYDPQQ